MKDRFLKSIPYILLAAALGLCIYGIVSGDAEDVLMKAAAREFDSSKNMMLRKSPKNIRLFLFFYQFWYCVMFRNVV